MTTERLDCAQVRRRSSPYLDGRLSALSRQRVQRHLRECESCVAEYRILGRLSRATHNLPPRQVVADLGDSVRHRVTTRREKTLSALGSPQRRWLVASAAALVGTIAGAWWLGYDMGREASTRTRPIEGGPPAVVVDSTHENPFPAGEEPRFVLASHGLLRDLAMIENVEPRGRRPLLAAQVAYFDLDADATRIMGTAAPETTRALAGFIAEFARALADEAEIDWAGWCRKARGRGLYEDTGRGEPRLRSRRTQPDRERFASIVGSCGGDLPERDRDALAELLELKDGYVCGRVGASIRYADRLRDAAPAIRHPFELPASFVVAETLLDAGLDDNARPIFTRLSARIERRSSDSNTRTMIIVRAVSSSGPTGSGNPNARELLDCMMRAFGVEPLRRTPIR